LSQQINVNVHEFIW